jgi:hypothetical protein
MIEFYFLMYRELTVVHKPLKTMKNWFCYVVFNSHTVRKGQGNSVNIPLWFWFKVNMHGLFRVYSLAPWFKWIYTEKSVYIYFESESLLPFSNSAHVQRYWGSTVKMVFSYKIFTFLHATTWVALPNAWRRLMRALC